MFGSILSSLSKRNNDTNSVPICSRPFRFAVLSATGQDLSRKTEVLICSTKEAGLPLQNQNRKRICFPRQLLVTMSR